MRDSALGVSGTYNVERDDGRIEAMEVGDYLAPLLKWPDCERLGIQHARGRVLDIGCGAGRVALHLQGLGHTVVGIDSAPGAVEACKMRGLREAYVMSAAGIDFPDATFDTIVMYGNNFGVLGYDDSIVDMLRTLHGITTPHGIILAASADVTKTDDQGHLDYHKLNLARGRPKGLIRLRVRYKEFVGEWFDLRLASPEEMAQLAEQSGWALERKYQYDASYVGVLVKR